MQTTDTRPRTMQDRGSVVACACGATLFKLAPGEGVYPRQVLMRTLADQTTERKGTCPECGAGYTIPVSRWTT